MAVNMTDAELSTTKTFHFCYNGNLYQSHVWGGKVVWNIYAISALGGVTRLNKKTTLSLSTKYSDLCIVDSGSFEDVYSCVKKPYVVAFSGKTRQVFIITENNNLQLVCICKFQFQNELTLKDNSFKFIGGSLVVWQCEENIHVAFKSQPKQTTLDQFSFSILEPPYVGKAQLKLLSVNHIVDPKDDVLLFIGEVTYSSQEDTDSRVMFNSWTMQLLDEWTRRQIDSTDFIPCHYAGVVLDCKVTIKDEDDVEASTDTDVQFCNTTLLLLESHYFVHLCNGHIIQACCLGVTHLSKDFKIYSLWDHNHLILKAADAVCIFDVSEKKIKNFYETSTMVVGDFLQQGRTQCLLGFGKVQISDEDVVWQLVTPETCDYDYADSEVKEKDFQKCSKLSSSVAESLENHLQKMLAVASRNEDSVHSKTMFLRRVWHHLHMLCRLMGSEKSIYPEAQIADFVDNTTGENLLKPTEVFSSTVDQTPELDLWCYRVDSKFTVGVDVAQVCSRRTISCTLSIVPTQKEKAKNVRTSFSQWCVNSNKSLSARKSCKNSEFTAHTRETESSFTKGSHLISTATCDVMFPDELNDLNVWALLSIKDHLDEKTPSRKVLHCTDDGCVNQTRIVSCRPFSLALQHPTAVELVAQKLMTACEQNQVCTCLKISSRFTNLNNMVAILESQTGFCHVQSSSCLINVSILALQQVLLKYPVLTDEHNGCIEAWTRDSSQLDSLLQYLQLNLSEDISVTASSQSGLVTGMLSSLRQEIKDICHVLEELVEGTEKNRETSIASKCGPDSNDFSSISRDKETVAMKRVTELQLKTDAYVGLAKSSHVSDVWR